MAVAKKPDGSPEATRAGVTRESHESCWLTAIRDELGQLGRHHEQAPPSDARRLRLIFADVERAIHCGVPQADSHRALQQQGFTFTVERFRTTVLRLRREVFGRSEQTDP